jgi:hypothetical protein
VRNFCSFELLFGIELLYVSILDSLLDLLHLFGAMLIAIFFHGLALFLFASLHPDFNIIEFLILGDLECFPFLTKQV